MRGAKIEKLWFKLLLVALAVFGPLILVGYLYYQNNSCGVEVWNCLQFDVIMLGGGVLLFCLPIVIILFLWEIWQKVEKKNGS